jgi:hypothetical protein
MLAGVTSAQPSCNDIHVVGVEAVDPNGVAQGLFDKLAGDVICTQFDLIEIGAGGYPFDILVEIKDPSGIPVQVCCLDDFVLPGVGTPFVFGPLAPPADFVFACCYPLQPDDPVGNYTIAVTVFDFPGSCVTACVPGSWNQAEVEVTGVVPVELSSFEAISDAGRVNISWETASEEQNLGFYVLRSSELDAQCERISELIDAEGTPSTGAVYSYVDKPEAGVYYYRLEDVATDGSSTIHQPVRVVVGEVQSWGAVKSEFTQ